ncbi:MAG TPA: hypothetical protein VGB37_12705 [Candidatus Lokiarchaeia archaeon]
MKKKLEQLTEKMWDFLTACHERVWLNDEVDEQRYEIFRKKIDKYQNKGYDVSEFIRYAVLYEEHLERRKLRGRQRD